MELTLGTTKIQIVHKSWGREEIIVNNDVYCLKKLTCEDRKWSSKGKYHYHRVKDETFYVIQGRLEMDVVQNDGIFANFYLFPYQTFRVPPGMKHRFRSVGDRCVFYEVSTTHRDEDTVRCTHVKVGEKEFEWVEE